MLGPLVPISAATQSGAEKPDLGALPAELPQPFFGLGQEASLSEAPTMCPGPPTLGGLATMDIIPPFPGEEG